jgi:hypothetical protein
MIEKICVWVGHPIASFGASHVLLGPKPDGFGRFCVDYIKLGEAMGYHG